MLSEKINLCVKELELCGFRVSNYKLKYKDNYGFISAYFKSKRGTDFLFMPAIIIPDETEDSEEYEVFFNFLNKVGLTSYFYNEGVLDTQSIVSVLKFIEYERFRQSGKKALHLDLSEYNYEKSVIDVISDYLEPFSYIKDVKCIYNEQTHDLLVIDNEDNEYFDEAREFLGL